MTLILYCIGFNTVSYTCLQCMAGFLQSATDKLIIKIILKQKEVTVPG